MPRKTIARYGPRNQSVRIFIEPDEKNVRAQWREYGMLRTRSWSNTVSGRIEAKRWARQCVEVRSVVTPLETRRSLVTIRELWERYRAVEFQHLRPKSVINYVQYWDIWERFAGRTLEAEYVTIELLGDFRRWLAKRKYAISRQRESLGFVKQVFRWGVLCELIGRDRLSLYRFKIANDERTTVIPEYAPREYRKLVQQLNPLATAQWRAWALLILIGELGPRINAALHLRWDDIDFDTAKFGAVIWRAEYDKLRRERRQPLTAAARDALYVALGWSYTEHPVSPWVFPARPARTEKGSKGRPYTIQGFWWMLRKAEDRAHVVHVAYGAAHRLRRMAAGNALEITGNVADAMWWIGDTDLRHAHKYLRPRDSHMHAIAARVSQVTGNVPNGCRSSAAKRNQTVTTATSESVGEFEVTP